MFANHAIFLARVCIVVLLNSGGQILFKLGSGGQVFPNISLLMGLTCYGLSTLLYVVILSKLNLSVTYPVVIGSSVILTTLLSGALLGEKVLMVQWMGIGAILVGITAVALGKLL
jgi:small multidrug resistance pump